MKKRIFINSIMHGLTLAEMLVALGVFVILSTMITELFMQSVHAQRQTTEQQKLQDDLRFSLESIATDARIGVIDYAQYAQPIANPQTVLFLRDEDSQRIQYAISDASTQSLCPDATSSPCIIRSVGDPTVSTNSAAITRKGLKVNALSFYITPVTKPTNGMEPVVTAVIEVQSTDPKSAGRSITLQTTVTEKGKP